MADMTDAANDGDDMNSLPIPARIEVKAGVMNTFYTADQMRAEIASAVAAERERCARIVDEYNPGGSYHIRTVLSAEIRRAG